MNTTLFLAALVVSVSALPARAQNPPAAGTLAQMPVKEITVFKDGHALVLHEGEAPVTTAGTVVLDYLPMPVLGTFWPYSADRGAPLSSVPAWWNSYNWPHWWHRFNSVSRITWKLRLEPGQSVELGYTWHYFAP